MRHFVEIVIEDLGLDAFKKALTHSLGGLKVAPYYGCLMVRPPEVAGLDDPENPVYLDRLIDAMGGVGLDWPHKVECCGGSLTLTRSDLVVKLSESILAMAKDSGAECLAVACPMCQINLDMRQDDIFKATRQALRHADHLHIAAHGSVSGSVGGCARARQADRFAQSGDESCSVIGKVMNHGKR